MIIKYYIVDVNTNNIIKYNLTYEQLLNYVSRRFDCTCYNIKDVANLLNVYGLKLYIYGDENV